MGVVAASTAAAARVRVAPAQEILSLRVSVGGASTTLPLYATDAAVGAASLETAEEGVCYALEPDASIRLTQFGNKQSSKQRQNAYALRLRHPGRVALRIDPGAAGESLLCLQFYSERHQFLTQARVRLDQAEHEIEAPDQAAFGCFSVQLSGAGRIGDLAVAITPKSTGGESIAIESSLRTPDDLLTLFQARATAADALREAVLAQPELVVASIRRWFSERRYHEIIQFLGLVRAWDGRTIMPRVHAYALLLSARAYANMNATRSTIRLLRDLRALDGWAETLDPRDAQGALILHGQALVRNGNVEEGVKALDAARLNEPGHWEAYFLLANNLADDEAERRDSYYAAAATLIGRPHPKLAAATIENHLRRGRRAEALAVATESAGAMTEAHDLWLALANIHLQAGDGENWRRFVGRYFEQHGLVPPEFETDPGSGALRYAHPARPQPQEDGGPRVAVIMTTFNSAATLEHAARSVLSQTHGNVVLGVVDDCSDDDTRVIAAKLAAADPRVRLFKSARNSGTYLCKNIGLVDIEADYYTFHDSDDWMHPERVARHLDVMTRTEAACTTSLWFRMSDDGRVMHRHSGGYQHTNPASIFVRRDVLQTVGLFDCVRTGADTEYVWRIRNRYGHRRTIEIAQPLAIGLHHDASLTQSGVAAFDRHRYSEVRLDYWESWVDWHVETLARDPQRLRLDFPASERLFAAPEAIMPGGGRTD